MYEIPSYLFRIVCGYWVCPAQSCSAGIQEVCFWLTGIFQLLQSCVTGPHARMLHSDPTAGIRCSQSEAGPRTSAFSPSLYRGVMCEDIRKEKRGWIWIQGPVLGIPALQTGEELYETSSTRLELGLPKRSFDSSNSPHISMHRPREIDIFLP